MAEVPSDIASSAAPASYQAKEVAKEREARRAAQVDSAGRSVKAVDEHGTTVDTEDADTAIFTDAEGTGSQGRPFEEPPESEQADSDEATPDGITRDPDGTIHLDLEA